ncbi:hypothetical protein Agub_g515, partial [Astrephomene gubernaculifera]
DTQYRMHPVIAAFPAAAFYGGRLRNGANTQALPLPVPLKQRVTFVDVPGWEQGGRGKSWDNPAQAREAVRLISELLRLNAGRLGAADIGVITPYRAMAANM